MFAFFCASFVQLVPPSNCVLSALADLIELDVVITEQDCVECVTRMTDRSNIVCVSGTER